MKTMLEGVHLKIATLDYPPFSFINFDANKVFGIEPSIIQLLSDQLGFTFDYTFASPKEMWGEFIRDPITKNLTKITGFIGILQRREVDVAVGHFYVGYERLQHIDYTQPYGTNYECFMVPVPRPFPKWTALYSPFEWPVWITLFFTFLIASFVLHFVDKRLKLDPIFRSFQRCILFLFGDILGVSQGNRGIRSITNRTFLVTWLFGSFIAATSYRSVLTSFMTSPYTPPPIETFQQLVDSSIGKITFSTFIRDAAKASPKSVLNELSRQMTITYNQSYMFSLMDSELWAIESTKEHLQYEAASRKDDYVRRHLMKECIIMPWPTSIGLQKNSILKAPFDDQIQKFVEAGLIEHHRLEFSKRFDDNPTRNDGDDGFAPLILNDLQGSFYLLNVGWIASILLFVIENIFNRLENAITL